MLETQRLFIAIELNSEIHQNLSKIITTLKKTGDHNLNWVKPENIHLTLKFLGETPVNKIEPITRASSEVIQSLIPFAITVVGTGCFPSPRQPRVFWAGLQAPAALNELQQDIEHALVPLGFSTEKRPFSPHLTLARVSENCPPEVVQAAYHQLLQYQSASFGEMQVDHITLFQSTLTREGAIYRRLSTSSFVKTE